MSFWGRFLKWSLTAGRYIIILTELGVIIAFMSRFKFDNDLSDLNDAILGKQTLLEVSANTEKVLRLTQSRLDLASQKLKSRWLAYEVLTKVTSLLPEQTAINLISITDGVMTLDASAVSESDLGSFVQAISTDKMFKSVDLTSVSSEKDSAIKFTIKVKL